MQLRAAPGEAHPGYFPCLLSLCDHFLSSSYIKAHVSYSLSKSHWLQRGFGWLELSVSHTGGKTTAAPWTSSLS